MKEARVIAGVMFCVMLAPLAICWGLWAFFAVMALLPGGRRRSIAGGAQAKEGMPIDILIPAHDEELLLPRLLESLAGQTEAGGRRRGRVLVVADHCGDRTAALARERGAEVLERRSGPRGKPAALRDGLAVLAAGADRAVLILDADCTVSANMLEAVGAARDGGLGGALGAFVGEAAGRVGGGVGQRLHTPAVIAFGLKNLIRPKGMARVGVPTQLFGTGMCFRGDVLGRISFADHLTEDLKISHDLLLAGVKPAFVAEAVVRSPLPEDRGAMSTQKLRWETGQIETWRRVPGMMLRLLMRGRLRSVVALMDWSSPPVAMAVGGWVVLAVAAGGLIMLGLSGWWILVPLCVTLCFLATYVMLGALEIGGPAGAVSLGVAVPRFFVWKMALYGRMLTGRGAKTWDRTPRSVAREGES